MAKIKSYTDIEQSRKLAEILPLESADMKILPFTEREYRIVPINDIAVCGREDEIYAWSLAALLCAIPKPDLVQNSEGTWLVHSWVNAYHWSVGGYSNPVDACYEIILKLHKLKFL
jgi:hypothetical protein